METSEVKVIAVRRTADAMRALVMYGWRMWKVLFSYC
jgi:hypothetical protein